MHQWLSLVQWKDFSPVRRALCINGFPWFSGRIFPLSGEPYASMVFPGSVEGFFGFGHTVMNTSMVYSYKYVLCVAIDSRLKS